MVQTRVCTHFGGRCKHSSIEPITFLTLPEHIRQQIYFHSAADIPSSSLVQLKIYEGAPLFCLADRSEELTTYATLRLVSRKINAEIPRCLASRYPVLLYGPEFSGSFLSILHEEPWDLLGYTRSLTIVLNGSTDYSSLWCPSDGEVTQFFRARRRYKVRGIWTIDNVSDFLPTWKAIIDRLKRTSHVADLELNIIADVEDSQAAKPIVDLLQPPLRISKCALRLHPEPSLPLEELAEQTALRVTGQQAVSPTPFRYLDLPAELRHRILEFTDLVSPYYDVQWSNQHAYHLQDRYRRSKVPCSHGEFCRNQGAVFPTCVCFQNPTPLFLVCRTTLQDARRVFYSSNRIVIVPIPTYLDPCYAASAPFLASKLFNKLDLSCLVYLRDLEIVLSGDSYAGDGIDMEKEIQHIWVPALQHARKLSLSLCLGIENCPSPDKPFSHDLRSSLLQLFRLNGQMVRPLRAVKSLDTFFVLAISPYDTQDLHEEARKRLREDLREHEKKLEAIVMGDQYNSIARGKLARTYSRWLSQMYVYA
jgi:hypothetical protein